MAFGTPKTQTNHNTCISKWVDYCKMVGTGVLCDVTSKEGMSFLAYFFHNKDRKHEVIAVAMSALSPILPTKDVKTFGTDPDVNRLVQRTFKLRSSLPKYVVTYCF